jgi:hypothetical protein
MSHNLNKRLAELEQHHPAQPVIIRVVYGSGPDAVPGPVYEWQPGQPARLIENGSDPRRGNR